MDSPDNFDPNRNRVKCDDGGSGHPGWASKPTKSWDENAEYTRPAKCADPYGPTDDFYKSDSDESGDDVD